MAYSISVLSGFEKWFWETAARWDRSRFALLVYRAKTNNSEAHHPVTKAREVPAKVVLAFR